MGKTIAIISQKGGVGKTTTAINLGASLAKLNKKVLIVDFDPQANATSGLGVEKSNNSSVHEVVLEPKLLSDYIISTSTNNLKLLPSNSGLANIEVELVSDTERELKLKKALELAQFDYIIIDCPPSLGLLSINALVAANLVLIPVQSEYYALEGLAQLLETIQIVKRGLNPKLELLGILSTMYDKRTNLSSQVNSELSKYFNDKVFKTVIPRNVKLAEAPSFGKTIFQYDKWSKGAKAYKQLGSEVASLTKESNG